MEEDPNIVFFLFHLTREIELTGYPCVITKASTSYKLGYWAFPFPKNSPYRKLFSHHLLAMRQSGQIQRLLDMHITRVKALKEDHEKCKNSRKLFSKHADRMNQIVFQLLISNL